MLNWLIAIAVLTAILVLAMLVLAALTGFADIPCQDGIWDEAKHTCVQTAF